MRLLLGKGRILEKDRPANHAPLPNGGPSVALPVGPDEQHTWRGGPWPRGRRIDPINTNFASSQWMASKPRLQKFEHELTVVIGKQLAHAASQWSGPWL